MTVKSVKDPHVEAALRAVDLLDYYLSLPPSHQKEYESWILDAKKPETRDKRITKMLAMLPSEHKG